MYSSEHFDAVIQDFINFLGDQQGMYMDALAGFAGHYTETERQVHRDLRATGERFDNAGTRTVIFTSYEDSTKPDVIHRRIIRAADYLRANAPGGSNERQQANALLVFIYTYWELETRPRLARTNGCEPNAIKADIMGDLRILRHAILHARGIVRADDTRRLKKITWLKVDEELHISLEQMKQIFIWIHQACALLVFEWLGLPDAREQAEQIVSFAIENAGRR